MKNKQDIFKEVRKIIEGGTEEIKEEKKAFMDKTTNQVSIKIPKSLALKSKINEKSLFEIVFNPKDEKTKEELNKSGLVIYLKEVKNETGKSKKKNS